MATLAHGPLTGACRPDPLRDAAALSAAAFASSVAGLVDLHIYRWLLPETVFEEM